MPLQSASLSQVLHLVCEMVSRENFSNSWRILKVLADGNAYGGLDINTPRSSDGWTPLCIACAGACLPLAFKLLESLAKRAQPEDNEEQREDDSVQTFGICRRSRDEICMNIDTKKDADPEDSYKDVLRISRKQAKEFSGLKVFEAESQNSSESVIPLDPHLYYLFAIIGVNALYFLFRVILSWSSMGKWNLCGMLLFSGVSYFTFGAIKSSLEVGANFEMYLDLFIVNLATQFLVTFSNYGWLLYLAVPGYAGWKIVKLVMDYA
ncbi:unnamed protein product [Cladocopium goreaui]|uniref:Uncharacterized protein n=1 Tax=Cladocopium goreaui TaxID=2562237 RepID=A0A9P1FGI8_9DINO|nr:unnamed protein product [Cladocopium goreaui]